MKIAINARLMPFTHRPGMELMLPATHLVVRAFPCRLQIAQLQGTSVLADFRFDLTGPVSDFTAQLNLEKGEICVWGKAREGFFRYVLKEEEGRLSLFVEKAPAVGLPYVVTPGWNTEHEGVLHAKTRLLGPKVEMALSSTRPLERLSLGCHKAQEWEGVAKRADLCELLPYWLRLGQWLPPLAATFGKSAVPGIVAQLEHAKEKKEIESALERLFAAGFGGMLVPRLEDAQFQGLTTPLNPSDAISPAAILTKSAQLIRQLFLSVVDNKIALLPTLLLPFHCGRLTSLQCGQLAVIDLEWSKRQVRRVRLKATQSGPLYFQIPGKLSHYRCRNSIREKGCKIPAAKPLLVEAGREYLLDRFVADNR